MHTKVEKFYTDSQLKTITEKEVEMSNFSLFSLF